ncbi:MAG: HPP family protein [Pseudohongiellaceae bacterium]
MKLLKQFLRESAALAGLEHNTTSHAEKLISAFGALLGILAVTFLSINMLDGPGAVLMVTSMGATAVLLFVVPHGAMSQPWPLIGGHLLSAVAGVTCQMLFPGQWWTGAVAVGLAIVVMQFLRCVHPPGGATALAAVIGGADIHALGYFFVLAPVLLNVASILAVAVLFNCLFSWRRYPAHLMHRTHVAVSAPLDRQLELTQEDFEAAMQQLNTFIDVTTEELIELLELASRHAEQHQPHPASIVPGSCYSNGKLGRLWSIRQVIDEGSSKPGKRDEIIYKTLAGDGAYATGVCEREAFRLWARFEVVLRDGRWVKIQELS